MLNQRLTFWNPQMKTYLVATVARYVLVDAENESSARNLGKIDLQKLYDDPNRTIEIHTVREATADEIQLWDWHHEMVERHGNESNS